MLDREPVYFLVCTALLARQANLSLAGLGLTRQGIFRRNKVGLACVYVCVCVRMSGGP